MFRAYATCFCSIVFLVASFLATSAVVELLYVITVQCSFAIAHIMHDFQEPLVSFLAF